MIVKVTVWVDIRPDEIESTDPAQVVRDEILSNLESLDYVTAATLGPVEEVRRV